MGTTSEKLTYLNTTKTLIKEELNLGGANITNEPFRAYKGKLEGIYKDFLANGTDTLWNNWEKVSGSGETITLNNTIEAKMNIVYKGNTSQNGTPTPDTPIPVQVVSGDNTIKVEGKNLLNKELIENGKATNDYGTPGAIPVVGTTLKRATLTPYNAIEAKPNTKYTFNMTSTTWRFAIAQMDTDKISLGDTGWQTTTPYTITTSANCRYIGFNFSKTDNTNISDEEFNSFINANLMMFEGESVIPYTPYTSQTYPINIGNIELCKIGTYQDKIYKDNGKWYLNKQIGKVVLDGSENWEKSSNRQLYNISLSSAYPPPNNYTQATLLSNYFTKIAYYINGTTDIIGTQNGIALDTTKKLYLGTILESAITDLETFKTWLSTHNTIVYYVLATPTTTEITDTTLISQLEAIKKSYNTQTNITQENNDLPFELDVVALGELESI